MAQAAKRRDDNPLVLHQDFKRSAHAVRSQQLGCRLDYCRFLIASLDQLIDPEAHQEMLEIRKSRRGQPDPFAGEGQARKIHVRRQILLPDPGERIRRHRVPVVPHQGPVLSFGGNIIPGGMAVINRDHDATIEHPRDPFDPGHGFQVDFRGKPDGQLHVQVGQERRQFRRGRLAPSFLQHVVATGHVQFPETIFLHANPVDRKRIHQFIREQRAGQAFVRQRLKIVNPSNRHSLLLPGSQGVLLSPAKDRTAFDQNTVQPRKKRGPLLPTLLQQIPQQRPVSRPHFHEMKYRGMTESFINLRKLTNQTLCQDRGKTRGSEEITPLPANRRNRGRRPSSTRHIVPMLVIIQREFHKPRKRQRTRLPDQRGHVLHQRRIRRFHGLIDCVFVHSLTTPPPKLPLPLRERAGVRGLFLILPLLCKEG